MSTSSRNSRVLNRRVNSLQNEDVRSSRDASRLRRRQVSYQEGYTYALRVAYLAYLLQPRARRMQNVAAPKPPAHKSSASFNDLMKDFSLVRDSKSTRLPHGFVAALEKRLKNLLIGRESRPEYKDALVKRTFAAFFNAFTEQSFKKRMEKDRRAEDLVLIFFSNATKELQKGKPPGDEGVKMMVDRHVALFVRLIGVILKDADWASDRPELATRLATLESKLLIHDSDLSEDIAGGLQVEVVAPLSYEVKDMPLVQVVGRIFGLTNTQVQSDITSNKDVWTEKAALQDLKTYQTHLNLNTHKTLTVEDFELEDAYEIWKKAEAPDLSQMMLAIVQANPELAKATTASSLPQFSPQTNGTQSPNSEFSEASRRPSWKSEDLSSYVIDQAVDISSLNLGDGEGSYPDDEDSIFTYIPPDPRAFYKFVLATALAYDLQDTSLEPTTATSEAPSVKLLSKQSTELLSELALRWRIPMSSRAVLFLEVFKEKFADNEISLDNLDAAFTYIKEPVVQNKRSSMVMNSAVFDRKRWTISDVNLMRRIMSDLHETLHLELYNALMRGYGNKAPPTLGSVLYVLDMHVRSDPHFEAYPDDLEKFKEAVTAGLREKASGVYGSLVDKNVPPDQSIWEFFHVIQLGKSVTSFSDKIQKRYKKNPEIEGVNLLMIFLDTVLPSYAEDAREIVSRIIQDHHDRGEEVPIQDGFDLYRELVEIRRVHAEALPDKPFAFHIEDQLADFVWRWISVTAEQVPLWVEEAIKQDQFQVRTEAPGLVPTADERHSTSVLDIFRSFHQVIDQVAQLNWDNDIQYAKFMTALSKAIGTGLAKYCELVEQSFAREMDRLTPEQEATLAQTRQEKWMQLAKDAWSKQERVEPFQFFPESFVKLNNIAFAIHQWDKLEHEVNVDACADVLQRNAPPVAARTRKNQRYVFTIKIVEAEDLKACDMNGLSDPYVVLTDEYQKRLSKTRVIYGNLNPRWEDSVDITTTGALNIIATIWDYDTLGDHDYVGRTSLKLDPSHFSDFLPREYWLDLDTQGRLLLRVSMEGERDDIQFYFGKAFRALKRTERDMTRKITDKLSAYINHCLSRRTLRQLLSRGISMSSVSNYFNRNRQSIMQTNTAPTDTDVLNALKPLFTYFDDNFAIMNQTLTSEAMIMVMTRLWKEVLMTIESLLVPPLSDKPSQQRPLTQQELDIVFKWLRFLFDFFHAVDDETGEANGVPMNVLKSPKYHEIQTLNFFYSDTTENLIRTSERMASATAARQQATRSRLSAPPSFGAGPGGLAGVPSTTRRAKSIMLSRNLGTMKKAKEEKWKEAQADPNDDMILRILRMRPEAAGYLRDRSRQKERLAAAAAAEVIVRQSLMAGGGRMTGATSGLSRR